jgi:4'-phosphopantetheinyl transferase
VNTGSSEPALLPDRAEVVLVDLAAASDLLEAAERDVPRLSADDCARVERLTHDPERKRTWRALRIATRIVLERFAGTAFRKRDFEIEDYGRPTLGAEAPYFSVSRTGHVALIAVSKAAAIGIDIEQVRPFTMTEDRRRRVLAASARLNGELARSQSLDDACILEAWVCLEAVAKARGTGIGPLLTEEGVVGGQNDGSVSKSEFEIRRLDMPRGYVAAVAAKSLPSELPVVPFPDSAEALARFLMPAVRQ